MISLADLREVTSSRTKPGPASRGPSLISFADLWRSLLRWPGQGQPPEDLSHVVSYPTEINGIRYPLCPDSSSALIFIFLWADGRVIAKKQFGVSPSI